MGPIIVNKSITNQVTTTIWKRIVENAKNAPEHDLLVFNGVFKRPMFRGLTPETRFTSVL